METPKVDNTPVDGIVLPVLQYEFRIIFGDERTFSAFKVLTREVASCKIDIKNQKLYIEIRQPVTVGVFNILNYLMKFPHDIFLDTTYKNSYSSNCVQFYNCECLNHSIEFNYSKTENALHKLEFSYSRMGEMEPVDWKKASEEFEQQFNKLEETQK